MEAEKAVEEAKARQREIELSKAAEVEAVNEKGEELVVTSEPLAPGKS